MKYTFLLPAYKSRFLEQSLRSILSQTYTDFNVIVSDDCSPEDIKSIVDKFSDSRVTYRRNASNIGVEYLVNHWNLLLGLTDAEYVIMASDDDVYENNYLAEIDKLVVRYPEICVFRTRMSYVNSSDERIFMEPKLDIDVMSQGEYALAFATQKVFSGISQNTFNRRYLMSIGGFFYLPVAWFSDDVTVFEMAKNGIAISDSESFHMRWSEISISEGKQTLELIKHKVDASIIYQEYMYQQGLPETTLSGILERTRRTTLIALKKLNGISFFRAMIYSYRHSSKIYPMSWCIRKSFGHIYYDCIKKEC